MSIRLRVQVEVLKQATIRRKCHKNVTKVNAGSARVMNNTKETTNYMLTTYMDTIQYQ